jgi:hypothetical protein
LSQFDFDELTNGWCGTISLIDETAKQAAGEAADLFP